MNLTSNMCSDITFSIPIPHVTPEPNQLTSVLCRIYSWKDKFMFSICITSKSWWRLETHLPGTSIPLLMTFRRTDQLVIPWFLAFSVRKIKCSISLKKWNIHWNYAPEVADIFSLFWHYFHFHCFCHYKVYVVRIWFYIVRTKCVWDLFIIFHFSKSKIGHKFRSKTTEKHGLG